MFLQNWSKKKSNKIDEIENLEKTMNELKKSENKMINN